VKTLHNVRYKYEIYSAIIYVVSPMKKISQYIMGELNV